MCYFCVSTYKLACLELLSWLAMLTTLSVPTDGALWRQTSFLSCDLQRVVPESLRSGIMPFAVSLSPFLLTSATIWGTTLDKFSSV